LPKNAWETAYVDRQKCGNRARGGPETCVCGRSGRILRTWRAASFSELGGRARVGPRSARANPAPASAENEEIIVTARRVAESLQDVPVSVSAFTADELEARGLDSIEDLARATPNLNVTQGIAVGSAANAAIFIRGIGQRDSARCGLAITPIIVAPSGDYFTAPDSELREMHALLTIVGRRVVYAEQAFEHLDDAHEADVASFRARANFTVD
jgi:hypothetical protein